ncbi:hypothetical protein G9A89_002263 [Geosiphon pyriformis]|nr:hypothetical protein G9A89_002263 [Geosiphon pyriformis]
MDLKATFNSNMSKKKAPKDVFYDLTGGSFSQKKKIVFGNVKYSNDKKDISLNKSEFGDNVFSNVDSLSGDEKISNMTDINIKSFLDSAANTSKAKHVNTSAAFGSPLGSPNFDINNNEEMSFPSYLSIFLNKKWVDPKIIKTQVEVSVKQSFTLDINLLTVEGKSAMIIKKILIDTPKKMIIATVSEFGNIKSIKIQLIGMWQKAVDTWMSRNCFRAFLFTLLVGTTVYDFGTLLERAGEKTCVINCFLETGNWTCCTVIGFEFESKLKFAFHIELIFGGMKLFWARLDLVWYKKYGKFGHSALECDASDTLVSASSKKNFKRIVFDIVCKKNVSISCSAAFGDKSWAQVVSFASFGGLQFDSGYGFGSFSSGVLGLDGVSDIVCKLSNIELVPLALPPSSDLLVAPININLDSDLNIVLDGSVIVPVLSSVIPALGLSSSKILMTKFGASKVRSVVCWLRFLGVFCFPMINLVWKIATCNVRGINNLAKQEDVVCWYLESDNMVSILTETKIRACVRSWIKDKFEGIRIFTFGLEMGFLGTVIEEIPGQIISVHLLFKNKFSVIILGLYAGASVKTCFSQASSINSFISKTVNTSSFVVLGGNFNENRLKDSSTWSNLHEVSKTINDVFVSDSLVSAIVEHEVISVSKFFDINHEMIGILVGLEGLIDACLNNKFKIKNTDMAKWMHFKELFLARLAMSLTDEIFSKHWFSKFDCPKNKQSSKFFKLESLLAKIMKCLSSRQMSEFDYLVQVWSTLDDDEASKFLALHYDNPKLAMLLEHLSKAKKDYHKSKYYEAELTKNGCIRDAIDKHIKNFILDKSSMIRSVLKQPFCKVVLNHLVIGDKLVLEPGEVKFKVDEIIMDWTHKRRVTPVLSDFLEKLSLVVSGLPNRKTAGLSGIPNKLWQHCGDKIMTCFLDLLNSCLKVVLTNTRLIALIETARKILSKVLLDCILSACSKFGILHGDNFSSPVFAVGSVVKDALKKDREIWIMTDFGLSDDYVVHDDLDQGEVFFSLLWRIFYDSLLCKIKRQEHLCGYRINSNFVAKTGRVEASGNKSSFFTTGVFVDDTIWIENDQASTQYILDITSEFFEINDIFINNDKTVTILINQRVADISLSISNRPISVVRKGESHRYLGIFLSTEGLSKPSLAKAYVDVRFFSNMVFKKTVFDKQFLYLVLAVLKPIVQIEVKVASIIGWTPLYPLCYPVKLRVCPLDNFLAGVIRIFVDVNVFLSNHIPSAFCCFSHIPMFGILGPISYFNVVHSLKHFSIAFGNVLLDKQSYIMD